MSCHAVDYCEESMWMGKQSGRRSIDQRQVWMMVPVEYFRSTVTLRRVRVKKYLCVEIIWDNFAWIQEWSSTTHERFIVAQFVEWSMLFLVNNEQRFRVLLSSHLHQLDLNWMPLIVKLSFFRSITQRFIWNTNEANVCYVTTEKGLNLTVIDNLHTLGEKSFYGNGISFATMKCSDILKNSTDG